MEVTQMRLLSTSTATSFLAITSSECLWLIELARTAMFIVVLAMFIAARDVLIAVMF